MGVTTKMIEAMSDYLAPRLFDAARVTYPSSNLALLARLHGASVEEAVAIYQASVDLLRSEVNVSDVFPEQQPLFPEKLDFAGVVAVLPLFYENSMEGGFEPADDSVVLVQPCVVKALAEAHLRGVAEGTADASRQYAKLAKLALPAVRRLHAALDNLLDAADPEGDGS